MTLDGLIQFIALVAAVIAMMPSWRRQILALQLRWWDWAITAGLMVVMGWLYWPDSHPSNRGLDSELAFICAVAWLGFISVRCWKGAVPRSKSAKLAALLAEMIQQGAVADAAAVLQHALSRWSRRSQPDAKGESSDVQALLRAVTAHRFMRYVADARPRLAEMIVLQAESSSNIVHALLEAAISDNSSLLYAEVWDSQNLNRDGIGFQLPTHPSLVRGLFADARVCERHHAWAPIGDAALRRLKDLGNAKSEDPYRQEYDTRFWELDQKRDAVATALHYFDLMVTEALRQDIRWHMWLPYLVKFVPLMCENNRDSGSNRPNDEFPTIYCRLIVDCTNMLEKWVRQGARVRSNQNTQLRVANAAPEPANIVKMALIAFVRCISVIVASDLPEHFIVARVESLVALALWLHEEWEGSKYDEVLWSVLQNAADPTLTRRIRRATDALDWVHHTGSKPWITSEMMRLEQGIR